MTTLLDKTKKLFTKDVSHETLCTFKGIPLHVGQQIEVLSPSCQAGICVVTNDTYVREHRSVLQNLRPDQTVNGYERGGTYAYKIKVIN